MEYNGYKVGDIIHYTDESDEALGIIKSITRHRITIDWEWAFYPGGTGLDILEYDDFDALADEFEKLTEEERLIFLIRNT